MSGGDCPEREIDKDRPQRQRVEKIWQNWWGPVWSQLLAGCWPPTRTCTNKKEHKNKNKGSASLHRKWRADTMREKKAGDCLTSNAAESIINLALVCVWGLHKKACQTQLEADCSCPKAERPARSLPVSESKRRCHLQGWAEDLPLGCLSVWRAS